MVENLAAILNDEKGDATLPDGVPKNATLITNKKQRATTMETPNIHSIPHNNVSEATTSQATMTQQ